MKSLQVRWDLRFDGIEMEVPTIKHEMDIIPVSARLKLDVS